VEVAAYKLWQDPGSPYHPGSYAKACVQVSHLTPSGPQTLRFTTPNGNSNSLPFTVRSGNILWIATAGDDGIGNGSFAAPYRTISKCQSKMAAGDICLLGQSSSDSFSLSEVGYNWAARQPNTASIGVMLSRSGTAGNPMALVAYPGSAVTVDLQGLQFGRALQSYNSAGIDVTWWTIAGMTFNSDSFAVEFTRGGYIRFVDNDVMCTGSGCTGSSAGFTTAGYTGTSVTFGPSPAGGNGGVGYLYVYGNRFHDIGCHETINYATNTSACWWRAPVGGDHISSWGTTVTFSKLGPTSGSVIQITSGTNAGQMRRISDCNSSMTACQLDTPFVPDLTGKPSWKFRFQAPSKEYHNVYFSTNTNHVWFGWNSVYGSGMACRGVQFNSTSGSPQYDLHVHDNSIHNTVCDGINFASVNPSIGPVEAYNNLIYNAGIGPDPPDGPANYACIYNAGGGDALGAGGGGELRVYNNTMYNCGDNHRAEYPSDRGAIAAQKGKAPDLTMMLTNNIIVQPSDIPYVSSSSRGTITGASNDCFGTGESCPTAFDTNSLSVYPLFVNVGEADFHLQDGVLGIGALSSTPTSPTNLDGLSRSTLLSLGAY
jgi:hypothetical protein